MEEFILNLIPNILEMARSFWDSTFFLAVKILLGIYAVFVVLDVLLLVYLGNMRSRLRSLKFGSAGVSENKGRRLREWKHVKDRLGTDSPTEWKLAILEAEHLMHKTMSEVGYQGENLGEQLAQIDGEMYDSLDAMRNVHAFRNQIVHDDEINVAHEQATEAVGIYYDFLDDLGVV
jgi:hypothetical protein